MKIRILLLAGMIILSYQSLTAQKMDKELDPSFTHVVYFWLNNPDNDEDRTSFERSLKKFLDASKYAKTKFIGVPADTPREVVDGSFTYSLILSFSSKEAQDLYQKEAAHLKFIEESEHLWEKVVVYDSVGIKNL